MEHGNHSAPVDLDSFRASMRKAGIEEIVEAILSVFVEESRKHFQSLEESYSNGDADTLRRAVHTLKASAGNVRALALARVMESMEVAAAAGDLETVGSLMDDARAAYASVVEHMTREGYGV